MGQLTTSLLSKYGKAWTYSIAVNDLYYDFSAPALQVGGHRSGDRLPAADFGRRRLRAGVQAHPRQAISDRHRRRAAESAGLDLIDELNRAFAGEKPSGYVPPVHLFTPDNIDKDGGAAEHVRSRQRLRDEYKKIWGVK